MEIITASAATMAGLVILAIAGDKLVAGASALAQRLKVSDVFIGIVIIGFGTSLPEVMATASAAMLGKNDIALGNVVGSNIANIGLILGAALLLAHQKENLARNRRDYIAMVVALLIFSALLFGFGSIGFVAALGLLACLSVYLYLSLKTSKQGFQADTKEPTMTRGLITLFIIGGLLGLVGGANLLISGATDLARIFGVPERIIGITLVALGTSLPELAAAIAAARQKNLGLTVGNILGSNAFNVFAAGAAAALFVPLTLEGFQLDILVMLGFTALAGVLFFPRIKLPYPLVGFPLLLLYAGYTGYLFVMMN